MHAPPKMNWAKTNWLSNKIVKPVFSKQEWLKMGRYFFFPLKPTPLGAKIRSPKPVMYSIGFGEISFEHLIG